MFVPKDGIPLYIEKNLVEFLKEFIERQILFNPQDIEVIEGLIYRPSRNGKIKFKKREFTEKNIDGIFERVKIYDQSSTFLDILISDDIAKFIENSFRKSNEFYNNLAKDFKDFDNPDFITWAECEKNRNVEKQMYENGFLENNSDLYMRVKLFKHEVNLDYFEIVSTKNGLALRTCLLYINE